jgi:formylglycine-generating enzyme required for sulfatase activity
MTHLLALLICLQKPEMIDVDLSDQVKLTLVKIKPGSFTMGEGRSARQITLAKEYWIGATEVTQAQWKALIDGNPSYFKQMEEAPRLPVEQVSWDDCQKWIEKLNAKLKDKKASLPTEAEWEHACRAGTQTKWSFGEEKSKLDAHGWFENNALMDLHPVGSKKANPWGLYDMHGSVWEWCADWYGDADAKSATDPKGPDKGTERVIKGGSFECKPDETRCAARKGADPSRISTEGANKEIGFRVVVR